MSPERRSREQYSALLARAFDGAITVDGLRIVGHPSGMLIARTAPSGPPALAAGERLATDRDNDWSNV